MTIKDELKDYKNLLKLLEERKIIEKEMTAIVIQQLTWYLKESNKAKTWYNIINASIIILTATIPLINIIEASNLARVLTTIISIVTSILIGISRLKSFKTSWKNYRQSAEKIKLELRILLKSNKEGKIKIKSFNYEEKEVFAKEYFLEKYEEIVEREVGLWNQWLDKKYETTTGK